MLTVTGQNENVSHRLQIGENREEDNWRDDNGYQLNNIGFIDDISIFSNTPEGIQKLLNVVQEFTWNANQCEETYLLDIDNDIKRKKQEPAPPLTIDRENLQTMNLTCADIWDMGHEKRRHESNQESGQAKDHCST